MRPAPLDGEEAADDDAMDQEEPEAAGGDGDAAKGGAEAASDDDVASQPLQVDPELILQLVSYHQRVFGGGALPALATGNTFTSSAGSVASNV